MYTDSTTSHTDTLVGRYAVDWYRQEVGWYRVEYCATREEKSFGGSSKWGVSL